MVAGAALDRPRNAGSRRACRGPAAHGGAAALAHPAYALRETQKGGWFRAAPGHRGWNRQSQATPVTSRPGWRWRWTARNEARQGEREEEGALAGGGHPRHRAGHGPGQGRQGREGERGHALEAAAGNAAAARRRCDRERDAGEPGKRRYAREVEARALPVAGARQPARHVRRPRRPGLGEHLRRRRHQRDRPAAASRPAPCASCPSRTAWTSRTRSRPS